MTRTLSPSPVTVTIARIAEKRAWEQGCFFEDLAIRYQQTYARHGRQSDWTWSVHYRKLAQTHFKKAGVR